MLIKSLEVGHLDTNCYIVTDENTLNCAVIDPGAEANSIMDYIESNSLTVKAIFLTHGHFDHVGAAQHLVEETGAPIWINGADVGTAEDAPIYKYRPAQPTKNLIEGDRVTVGGLTFHVLETPGHSPGSVTLRCEGALFVGDTLFRDSCGRTDLPGGDMETLLSSLRRLSALEGDFEVYPGHGEATSLLRERAVNYYIKYAEEES